MALLEYSILKKTLTMVLAGGHGERIAPLTNSRSKAAVSFGGKYRIIDIILSNCLNSGLRRIYILTQHKSDSLNKHLFIAWKIFHPELREFIYSVPPQFKWGNTWYKGTADAVLQNIDFVKDNSYEYLLLLSSDHIYKMDYSKILQYHVEKKAVLTISCIELPTEKCQRYGIADVDENYKVTSFIEKPTQPKVIHSKQNYSKQNYSLANMGIYVFNVKAIKEIFAQMLKENISPDDFGKDVIPFMIKKDHAVFSFPFSNENKEIGAIWLDLDTIDSYYEASMDLTKKSPQFDFYDELWPIRTEHKHYPPVKTFSTDGKQKGRVQNSLISDGSIISGGIVERSVLGFKVEVNNSAHVSDSIIMDFCSIGTNARIRRAIIDKNVVIPGNTQIGFNLEEDKKKFTVTNSGIVVVPKRYVFAEADPYPERLKVGKAHEQKA